VLVSVTEPLVDWVWTSCEGCWSVGGPGMGMRLVTHRRVVGGRALSVCGGHEGRGGDDGGTHVEGFWLC